MIKLNRWRALSLLAVFATVVGLGVAPASADSATFTPVADTWVNSNQPGQVNGTAMRILANGSPEKYGLIQFDVSGIPAGATGVSGVLTLTSPTSQVAETVQIHALANGWDESDTYNTAPRPGALLDSGTMPSSGSVSFDVPISGNGLVSFAVTKTAGGDSIAASRENAAKAPELAVSWTAGTVAPPTADYRYDPVSGDAPLTVAFDNISTGADSYLWDFGDGTTSTAAEPGTHTFADPGSYAVKLTATNSAGSDSITGTVTVTDPTPPPPPPPSSNLPYGPDSFFQSGTAGLPVDSALTSSFHNFMATNVEQKATTWPKVNLNPGWSGENWIGSSSDPVWKLAVGSGGGNSRLDIVESQGVHLADKVWNAVPTGSQDRLLVVRDPIFGYTVQCADVVPNMAARTWTASNCGIFWHSSNGLDYRNPRSDDNRNMSSRGRIPDAMQVPRSELDAAVAAGTGVGHVLHIFFVQTDSSAGFAHPMTGAEGGQTGWGAEGTRIGINRNVDLVARGLTGAALALARTLQDNGAYIGDNSGSTTQIKVGPPGDYTGTNLATDVFKGKITWSDFVVYTPGSQ